MGCLIIYLFLTLAMLNSFSNVFYSSFVNFIPILWFFILLQETLLISFFVCSLLLYRNIIDFCILILYLMGFPGTQVVKNSLANARDVGSIPGSGRSLGGGNDISLQYSCLGNPMDRGAQWATVHEVTKSRMRLSMHPEEMEGCSLCGPHLLVLSLLLSVQPVKLIQ